MPDLTRGDVEGFVSCDSGHERSETVPTHCRTCGLRWPCDPVADAETIRQLARQLLDSLDRIAELEAQLEDYRR